MAIEWPSNAALRCGNSGFFCICCQTRPEPAQTRPAAQLNRLASSARDAHVIALGRGDAGGGFDLSNCERGRVRIKIKEFLLFAELATICGTCENCRNLTDRVKCRSG